jgi:protein-disulfide isomerase-like protein with CxxC motif
MIEFNAENIEDLEEEAKLKATEISIEITKAVCKALEEGVDVVAMGFLAKLNMDISVKKENFLEALELNFKRIEEAEEFELCQEATKWIDILRSDSEKEG